MNNSQEPPRQRRYVDRRAWLPAAHIDMRDGANYYSRDGQTPAAFLPWVQETDDLLLRLVHHPRAGFLRRQGDQS